MKYVLHPPTGQFVILGDDNNKVAPIHGDAPSQEAIVDTRLLYGATHAKHFSQGNRINVRAFNVDRNHADRNTAFIYKETHADSIPLAGILEINNGGTSRWMQNAVVTSCVCIKYDGVNTVFRYTVKGGRITSNRL